MGRSDDELLTAELISLPDWSLPSLIVRIHSRFVYLDQLSLLMNTEDARATKVPQGQIFVDCFTVVLILKQPLDVHFIAPLSGSIRNQEFEEFGENTQGVTLLVDNIHG